VVTSAVEKLDDTKLKLSITVDAGEVKSVIDATVTRLSGTIKVPGFRPGRPVPIKVLESRIGKGAVQEEAIREAFPVWWQSIVAEHEVQAVGAPSLEIETFEVGKDGVLVATVDIRPEFEAPEFAGMEIAHPEWEVTEEEIAENLDRLRERFAEVETVERPAQKGDLVTVTITGKDADGNEVAEASAEDLLYQIPEEDTDSELDRQLPGAEAGAIVEFTDSLGPDYPEELAGKELTFTAIVKEVKHRTLPELDDDFALTASEFDTIDELRADLQEQMAEEKLEIARANLRGAVVEAVAELVDIPLPEGLVEEEQRFRLNRLANQAQQSGLSLEQFIAIAGGGDVDELLKQFAAEAEQTVKAQLVIDEVGQKAGITVEREDLGQEVARQAMRMGRDPKEIAELMMHPDRIGALYADAYRRKTIDHILEQVTITGAPPEPEPEDEPETPVEEVAEAGAEEAPVEETPAEETAEETPAED